MSRCRAFEIDPCTACNPRVPITPLPVIVRPGQRWIEVKAGTFATFRRAMLDHLLSHPVRSVDPTDPAAGHVLTTREPDDFAVAMLDLWAYVGDVLAFYNQADLNEAFLRTAVLRESVAMMARLIGYRASPGVAASVSLAFEADGGAEATLPAGFQVQSEAGPGRDPVTFETAEPLTLRAAANRPTLLGDPMPAAFHRSGILRDDSNGPKVAVGARLIFFNPSGAGTAQRVVTEVRPQPLGRTVAWAATLEGRPARDWSVSRLGRTLRPFGVNAPETYLAPAPSPRSGVGFNTKSVVVEAMVVKAAISNPDEPFTVVRTSFAGGGDSTLALDGTFDGLTSGTRLLLHYKPLAGEAPWLIETTVSDAGAAGQARGPLAATSTVLTLRHEVPSLSDVRYLTVYELLGDPLVFSTQHFSDQIRRDGPGGGAVLYVADASGLARGTRVLVASGERLHLATVSASPDRPESTAPADRVPITPGLPWDLDVADARLYGNVVAATQGETRREMVLGDGDASRASQEFLVPAAPVTYVPDPASDTAASSTLRLLVDGQEWTEVPSLFGRGPDEPVFVTHQGAGQSTWVRGGDGRNGRRFPTGRENLHVRMRKGLGTSANAPAGSISMLLQTWPGVSGVTNPGAAAGGAEPEAADAIRAAAPADVTTLGRAVSVRDYERLTLAYLHGGQARASWGGFHGRAGWCSRARRPAAGRSRPSWRG